LVTGRGDPSGKRIDATRDVDALLVEAKDRAGEIGRRVRRIAHEVGCKANAPGPATSCSFPTILRSTRTMIVNVVRGSMRTRAIRLRRSGEIVSADRELRVVAKKDDCCPRLMSVPGIGPTTAIAFKATLDVVERFTDAHQSSRCHNPACHGARSSRSIGKPSRGERRARLIW
jgi:hypothetical protein